MGQGCGGAGRRAAEMAAAGSAAQLPGAAGGARCLPRGFPCCSPERGPKGQGHSLGTPPVSLGRVPLRPPATGGPAQPQPHWEGNLGCSAPLLLPVHPPSLSIWSQSPRCAPGAPSPTLCSPGPFWGLRGGTFGGGSHSQPSDRAPLLAPSRLPRASPRTPFPPSPPHKPQPPSGDHCAQADPNRCPPQVLRSPLTSSAFLHLVPLFTSLRGLSPCCLAHGVHSPFHVPGGSSPPPSHPLQVPLFPPHAL